MKKNRTKPQKGLQGEKSTTPTQDDLDDALSPLRQKINEPGRFVIDEGVICHRRGGTTTELYRLAFYRKGKLRKVVTTTTITITRHI